MTDALTNAIKRHVASMIGNIGTTRVGVVQSVNAADYTAKVMIQPEGIMSGWLPIAASMVGGGWGMVSPPSNGEQVAVLAQEGDPEHGIIVGRIFSNAQQPPTTYTDQYSQANTSHIQPGEVGLVHQSGTFLRLIGGRILIHGDLFVDGQVRSTGDTHADKNIIDLIGTLNELRQDYNNHLHHLGANLTGPTTIPDLGSGVIAPPTPTPTPSSGDSGIDLGNASVAGNFTVTGQTTLGTPPAVLPVLHASGSLAETLTVYGNVLLFNGLFVNGLTQLGVATAITPLVNDNTTSLATTAWVLGQGSTIVPLADNATPVAGLSKKWAHEDHVHPTDPTLITSATAVALVNNSAATIVSNNIPAAVNAALPLGPIGTLYGGSGTVGVAKVITLGSGLSMAGSILSASTVPSVLPTTLVPVIGFGGANAGIIWSYDGSVLVVNNTAVVSLHILIPFKGTSTGQFSISGFPPPIAPSGTRLTCGPWSQIGGTDLSAILTGDTVTLFAGPPNGISAAITDADVGNGASLTLTGSYLLEPP